MSLFDDLDLKKLSSVEQEIYRFLLNNLESLPYMRVRDIANAAHVSSTSVFRFIKKIGFGSFPEFKFYLSQQMKLEKPTTSEEISLEQQINLLSISMFHPDVEFQIQKVANSLIEADLIIIIGLGASGAIAKYATRKLVSLGYFCLSMDELTYPLHGFLKKNKNTVLLFLSISGETNELIELISGIEEKQNVKKYCITQSKDSTLSRLCDYSIEYRIKENRKNIYFDLTSQLPSVAVLETLISYLTVNSE